MSRTDTGPPPEAVLIRRGREALGISPETASRQIRIKLSGRRWRQLEAGEEGPGGPKAVMSDGQLAHMAAVVGLQPGQLKAIGRIEAAAILQTIQDRNAAEMTRLPKQPERKLTFEEVLAELVWLREENERRAAEHADLRRQLLEEIERSREEREAAERERRDRPDAG